MPDFRMQQNFPIATVIDAAGRNAQLQEQSREAGNKALIEGLQSIGEVGQSLYDTKKRVAQSLALGRKYGLDDDVARSLEPDQILKGAAIDKGNVAADVFMDGIRLQMGLPPRSNGATTTPATATPASSPAAPPAAPASGAMLTSDVQATPMDAAPNPAPLMPPTTGQMPVPIPAPPAKPRMLSPAEQKVLQHTADMANKNRQVPVVSDEDALKTGTVDPRAKIIHGNRNSMENVSWASASPQQQSLAQAMYEGRVRPSDIGFRDRGKITLLANEYASERGLPPFRAYAADVNATMGKYSTSGKMGQNALSLNTALGHASSAYDSFKAIENTNVAWLNTPINKLKKATNDPNVIALGINLNALHGELANVFKNSGATDQEISHWRDYLSDNLTPAQYVGALGKIDDLLRSRLDAMEYQRSSAGGGNGQPLMSPHAKDISEQLKTPGGNSTQTNPPWNDASEQRLQMLLEKKKQGTLRS